MQNAKKKIFLFVLSLIVFAPVFAEKGAITGVVVDASANTGIPGAVIEVTPKSDPENVKYFTSGYNGIIQINGLEYGDYKVVVSFLGYDNATLYFSLSSATHNIGTVLLQESAVKIDAVVRESVSTRTTQMGDTLSYNADAFKSALDADMATLLNKMPGISVSGNTIEAQGEQIKSVYVDGNEFFGGSVEQALQTLPAQAVERIEVYDRLSETGQATGIADGGGGKVINIITRGSLKHSQFGKLHVGAGYEPTADPVITAKAKYTGGGAVNIFDGDRRMSVMALVNNLNKQNFSSDDISISSSSNRNNASRNYSVNTQRGVGTSQIGAFNLTDKWGRRKNFRFDGTLFFNHTDARNRHTIDRWYEDPAKKDTMAMLVFSNPDNYTARFRSRMEWDIVPKHRLIFIPNITFADNSSINMTNAMRWGESGYRRMPSGNNGWSRSLNMSLYGQYRALFAKPARMLVVDFSVWRNRNRNGRKYYSNGKGRSDMNDPMLTTVDTTYTRSAGRTASTGVYTTLTYREPIAKHAQVSFIYRPYVNVRQRDYNQYSTDRTYEIDEESRNKYTSNDSRSSFMYQRGGVAFRYARKRNWATVSALYQYTELSNRDHTNTTRSLHGYHHLIYNATLQWSFDRSNSMRISLNSDVRPPGMGQLQDFYNVSNSQYISRGNSGLKPYYEQTFFARYTRSVASKGRTFMVMFQARNIMDYIASSIDFSPEGGIQVGDKTYYPIQFTQPVNMDGYWRLTGRMSVGLPINPLRSNLNLTGGVDYSTTPTRVNGERNLIENMSYSLNMVLGSNISDKVDFTVSWNGAYNTVSGSLSAFDNNYFMHKASGQVKLVFRYGFTFTANCLFTQYIGMTNGFNDSFVLLNMWLGKKLFRSGLGEVQVGVNDLFNDNMSFGRSVWAGYSQVRYNSVLGRHFLVRVVYNLRHLSGGKAFRQRKDLVLKMVQNPFEKTAK